MHEVNDVKTAGGHFKEDDDVFAIKNKKGMFRLTTLQKKPLELF